MNNKSPQFASKRIELIQDKMQSLCDEGFYRDLAWEVGTVDKDSKKILFQGFVGQSGLRANNNSLWRIYSMTKPLVSVVALKLIEDGKLRLFDHVARFLPQFKISKILIQKNNKEQFLPSTTPMNVFHLLTHTSGLSYGFWPDPVANIYRKEGVLLDCTVSLEEEAKRISTLPLLFNSGSDWNYSVSTDILAFILECVTDMPLNDILKKYLFNKLGMSNIGFEVSKNNTKHILPCYGGEDILGDQLIERNIDIFSSKPSLTKVDHFNSYPENSNNQFRRGGHGLISSLEDYSLFASNMLNNGKGILSRKSMELMLTDHTSEKMKPLGMSNLFKPSPGLNGDGFGLGFKIRGLGSSSLLFGSVGEFGWGGAAETLFFIDPVENFYAVFMAQNLDQPGASALFKQLVYSSLR